MAMTDTSGLKRDVRPSQHKPYQPFTLLTKDWDDDGGFVSRMMSEIASTGSYKSGCEFDTIGGNDPFNGREIYRNSTRHDRDYAVSLDSYHTSSRFQARAAALQDEWEQEQAEKQRQKQATADREWAAAEAKAEAKKAVDQCERWVIADVNGHPCGHVLVKPEGEAMFAVVGHLWCAHKTLRDAVNKWQSSLDVINELLATISLHTIAE